MPNNYCNNITHTNNNIKNIMQSVFYQLCV